tara:strand:- start:311 stop:571 length:261 start_codon:yes stop_codon:yes gene_type:complete
MGKSKTSKYYENNPEAAEKRRIYQRKLNKTDKQKKYRAEHTKERRRRGIDGQGGDDVSKKKNGKFVLENPFTNRARNGADGSSTKK